MCTEHVFLICMAPRTRGAMHSHHPDSPLLRAPPPGATAAAAAGSTPCLQGQPIGTPEAAADNAAAVCMSSPCLAPRYLDTHLNLLMVGAASLGKASFAANFAAGLGDAQLRRGADGGGSSADDFRRDPQALCTLLSPIDIPQASRRLHISIQVGSGLTARIEAIVGRVGSKCHKF